MRLGGQTITIVNQGTQTGNDALGKPVYGPPVSTVVANCSVQEEQTQRDISLTDVVETRYILFAPPDAPLTATSTVTVGGVSHLVDGQPAPWRTSLGVVHHIECQIRRQAG